LIILANPVQLGSNFHQTCGYSFLVKVEPSEQFFFSQLFVFQFENRNLTIFLIQHSLKITSWFFSLDLRDKISKHKSFFFKLMDDFKFLLIKVLDLAL